MKKIKTISILICIFILPSCATKKMWENPSYKEMVKSHLITEDGEKIAIIGKKHYYIVPVTKELKEILLSNKTQYTNPLFHSFKVDKKNGITGKYYALDYSNEKNTLSFNKGEFTQKKDHPEKVLKHPRMEGEIIGNRYVSKKTIDSDYKLKTPYYITVEEEPSILSKAGKILATPITVVADGALLLGGVALIVILTNPYYFRTFQ